MTIVLSGIVNGLLMNFIPMYTKWKYESRDFGKILGLLFSCSAIGKVIICNFIFNIFWEMYQINDICIGRKCYFFGFVINGLFYIANLYICYKKTKKKYEKEKNQVAENKENNNNNQIKNNNIIINTE
jgi:Na+/melibiose symporter-like transporter